jgi:hypothetical protein
VFLDKQQHNTNMTLSDTHYALIESLEGRTCLCSSMSTYRPCAPRFEAQTFRSSWILLPLEWSGSARIVDVQVVETDSQIVITTCDDDSDATITTYIFAH